MALRDQPMSRSARMRPRSWGWSSAERFGRGVLGSAPAGVPVLSIVAVFGTLLCPTWSDVDGEVSKVFVWINSLSLMRRTKTSAATFQLARDQVQGKARKSI